MLIEKYGIGTAKAKFIYKCDRCKKIITIDDRYVICVQEPHSTARKRKWDLCDRCYNALQRGIQKGKKEIQNE